MIWLRTVVIVVAVCFSAVLSPAGDKVDPLDRHKYDVFRLREKAEDWDASYRIGMRITEGYASGIELIVGGIPQKPDSYEAGLAILEQAAEAGHVQSMYMLGRMLSRKHPPEFARSADYLKRAAELGHTRAQYEYGALCGRGLAPEVGGIEHEWFKQPSHKVRPRPPPPLWQETAITWFERAARQNHLKSRLHLREIDMDAQGRWERERPISVLERRWNGKDCQLIYVNGMNTTRARFDATLTVLRRIVDIDGFGEHISVDGVFFPNEPEAVDLVLSIVEQKIGNARQAQITPTLSQLKEKVDRGLEAGRQVILVGHSRGNLHIHDLLTLLPNAVDRVRVIALGSPTYTIPGKYVTYIRERRDPVAILGAVTETGGTIPSHILDMVRVPANFLKGLGLLKGEIKPIHFEEREGVIRDSFVNPLLYFFAAKERARPPTAIELYQIFNPTPTGAFAKAFREELFGLFINDGDAHDVIRSYLLGPGMHRFLGHLRRAAGVVETLKSPLPPPKRESYYQPVVVNKGSDIVGRWRREVNGRDAGLYEVWQDDSGHHVMKLVDFAAGYWPPARSIDDIVLNGDEWLFTVDWGFTKMPFRLVQQTPDIFSGIVQGNDNRWVRVGEVVEADDPSSTPDPELPSLLEAIDATTALSPEDFTPIEPPFDPLGNIIPDTVSSGSTTSPDDRPPPVSVPSPSQSNRRAVLAVNPRGLVGVWTRYLNEIPTYDVEVIYDSGKKTISMAVLEEHSVAQDIPESFQNIVYTGREWIFDQIISGKSTRIHIHRENRDTYSSSDGKEKWLRKQRYT